jgi:uncharacterized Tic20 family protein
MIIHLSIMAGYLVPFAGFVVPVLLWQLKKHEHAQIDAHGRNVANWLLSLLVYAAVAWMMIFTLIGAVIGIPALLLLALLNVVFAIVGGIKANDGVVWAYPFTIRFFS